MKTSEKKFIPVMLTPFRDNGEVDYHALTGLTEFYLESGAGGLFANCLSSEMFALDPRERLRVTAHIVNVAGGSVPVVASGTFEGSMEEKAGFVKEMHDTGVEAVIILTNMMAGESQPDEVLNDRVFQLLELTGQIPLGLYECPVPYKRIVTPAQLGALVATNRIIYHKDTCLDIDQVTAKIEAAKGHQFGLYDAFMGHAVQSLTAGAAGLSCIQGNFFPEIIVWLCDHYDDPDLEDEVEEVQQFLIRNMEVMHDAYPQVAKYYLRKRGLNISPVCRGRSAALTSRETDSIDRLYKECNQLKQALNIL